jgi:DDE superfamily endonuclease
MNVPACAMPVLSMFRPTFSTPTYHRFLVLGLAAILTTGRHTVNNLVRTVRFKAPGHGSSYHRVFSQRRWSAWGLARAVITFLPDHVLPPGPVFLAGDDTVTEHPGPEVFGKGRHRDGVRSSHSYTAYRWGHKGVVVAVLVKLPFATRPWALPVSAALYRSPEWARAHGTRHKTPAHIARRLLARLMRWFPHHRFIFIGDTGYGTSATARFCHQHRRHLTVVSKFYGDAALYEPPPPRPRGAIGRPRGKGRKLASPQEVVASPARRTRLTVAWYGGRTRDIEVVTGTGPWSRIGEALVEIRWVDVHDCTGTHRGEYFFTTNRRLCPKQIVECYTQRWSIETTFQECREHLKLESAKCYGQQTVVRFTPCLFGLSTVVVLLYLQLPDLLRVPLLLSWRGKTTTTFADRLMCVRRVIWQPWFFQTPLTAAPFSKLPGHYRKQSSML